MVAVPAGLPVGVAAGRFLFVSQDQADAGTTPDYTIISGTVKFVCSSKIPLTVSSQDLVVVPLEFQAEFDSEGYIRAVGAPADQRGVELPASDSTVYNPSGFTWRLEFNIRDSTTGKSIKLDPINLFIKAGLTNQIADQMPLGESKGVIQIRGEKGTSISSISASEDGTLTFTLTDASTRTVDISEPINQAVIQRTLPSGIAIDSDGVPYILPGANDLHVLFDTDGVPYWTDLTA